MGLNLILVYRFLFIGSSEDEIILFYFLFFLKLGCRSLNDSRINEKKKKSGKWRRRRRRWILIPMTFQTEALIKGQNLICLRSRKTIYRA